MLTSSFHGQNLDRLLSGSMLADARAPSLAGSPVRHCCVPSGSTRRICASSVPTKTTFPIATQH